MSQSPPPVEYQGYGIVDRDTEHLKILSICWYIVSGLIILIGCFPTIYLVMGIVMIAKPSAFAGGPPGAPGTPPPAFIGWFFIVGASLGILFCWTTAILGFITAISLPKRRRRTLCFIASALACLQVPVGTTLGVFTLIVLSRPSIKTSST